MKKMHPGEEINCTTLSSNSIVRSLYFLYYRLAFKLIFKPSTHIYFQPVFPLSKKSYPRLILRFASQWSSTRLLVSQLLSDTLGASFICHVFRSQLQAFHVLPSAPSWTSWGRYMFRFRVTDPTATAWQGVEYSSSNRWKLCQSFSSCSSRRCDGLPSSWYGGSI